MEAVKFMTEKNAIDILLIELIRIHLEKSEICFSDKNDTLIRDAEAIIDNLNDENKCTIKKYIDSFTDHMAQEEVYLYTAGIKDGIRLMNWIKEIKEDS